MAFYSDWGDFAKTAVGKGIVYATPGKLGETLGNQIADPNQSWKGYSNDTQIPLNNRGRGTFVKTAQPNSNTVDDGVTGQVSGAYNGNNNQTAYSAEDMAYLDDQASLLQRMLQSIYSARDTGLTKLNDSYNTGRNRAVQDRSRALEDFQEQRYESDTEKQQALGRVNDNAFNLARSLRGMLGLASGAGSSAYQFTAPNAVARQASQQRGDVMSTFAENEGDLVTAENRAKVDYDNLLNDLLSQRKEREEEFLAGIYGQEQGIQNSLADISADRVRLQGGGYGATRVAQQPYRDNYLRLQGDIDALPNRYRTAVTPKEVKVNPVALRDYSVDRQALNANRTQGQDPYAPYGQFLRRKFQEQA